jgi:uncharacterized protein (DUF488 family)
MTASPPAVWLAGYERLTLPQLIDRLAAAGVRRVIDVRDVANSRRPGFAKKLLAASLDEAGVGYVHLRALGTPKAGRDANRAGRIDEFRAIYERAFAEPAAQLALAEAEALCRQAPSALLCYCATSGLCHRGRIGEAMAEHGFRVLELAPLEPGAAQTCL